MTNVHQKQQLRRKKIALRDQLSVSYCHTHAAKICDKLIQLSAYQQASSILFYMSIHNEIDMQQVIEQAWQAEKSVLLPRVNKDQQTMEAVQIDQWDQLYTGAYGIREPNKLLLPIDASVIDLVIVPGVAFDLQGYRLGYGGGYYDRFFTQYPNLIRIGTAYPDQVVPTVYPETHDRQLDSLLTSERLYEFW